MSSRISFTPGLAQSSPPPILALGKKGIDLSRVPVSEAIALALAGAIGGSPGSPTPLGELPLPGNTITLIIRGATLILIIG